jgi:uncharacterized protein YlxW (UPF0749 family)
MRSPRAQWTLAGVALVLGFLAIVQLRAQGSGGGLQDLSSQDLTTLIANVNQRNGQLAGEVTSLESQLGQLQAARSQGQSAVGGLQRDLDRTRRWAGLDAVAGRGVVVQCTGPIGADAVNDLLNDLKLAGGEALAIEDTRVVAGTVVAGPPGRLSVENASLGTSFRVYAIGNPVNLTAALTRIGGIIGRIQVASPNVRISVAPSEGLTLPATDRDLAPADARPHL